MIHRDLTTLVISLMLLTYGGYKLLIFSSIKFIRFTKDIEIIHIDCGHLSKAEGSGIRVKRLRRRRIFLPFLWIY